MNTLLLETAANVVMETSDVTTKGFADGVHGNPPGCEARESSSVANGVTGLHHGVRMVKQERRGEAVLVELHEVART